MLWTPQKGSLRVEHNTGGVGSISIGTAVTTGASSGTKGTPAQLIASTSFDAYWLVVMAHSYASTGVASDGCLDILIGSATEEILIPDLLMGYSADPSLFVGLGKIWQFPLYVPAGSRLSAQAAGLRTSATVRVGVYLYGGDGYPPFRVGSKVTTYGVSAVPNGVSVTAGATGAEGAWTQVTSGTTDDHFAIVPSLQNTNVSVVAARVYALDVGLGAATEEEIAQSFWYATGSAEVVNGPMPAMPVFQDIPAGSRLAVRASCSSTANALDAALHCVS